MAGKEVAQDPPFDDETVVRPEPSEIREPHSANDLDIFWVDVLRDVYKGSIISTEDAAKQLIVILSLLPTIYFAAISFSEIRKVMVSDPFLVLLFVGPIIMWLIGLCLATSVFIPRSYYTNLYSSSISRKTLDEIIGKKQKYLWWAYLVMIVGFFWLLASIVYYSLLLVIPPDPVLVKQFW